MKNKYSILRSSILSIALVIVTVSSDKDDNSNDTTEIVISKEALPKNAALTIDTYFDGKAGIKVAKQSNQPNIYNSIYKVILNNEFEIDFDKIGIWTEVEGKYNNPIPESFLLAEVPLIYAFCISTFPENYIVEIERERFGYTVELSNGTELIFDTNENFIGMDLDDDDEEIRIPFEDLPVITKEFIEGYYINSSIITIKKETDDGIRSYKIYLTNGVKIKFDDQGYWIQIESSKNNPVPSQLMPVPISSYLALNYPSFYVTEIEIEKNGFLSVEIYNPNTHKEIELEFDNNGNLIKTH